MSLVKDWVSIQPFGSPMEDIHVIHGKASVTPLSVQLESTDVCFQVEIRPSLRIS